jgi:ankyrin repeat protein
LESAIRHDDTQTIEQILKSNPLLANKNIRIHTPLIMALRSPHPKESIELLLKYGADINAKGFPFDMTPLQIAAWDGNIEAVKTLLAHHPDVNALQKEKASTPSGYIWVDTDETALNYAFVADNKEIFNLLLAAGADINRGRSTLSECMNYAEPQKKGWAEFLLSKGADPNRVGTCADRFAPLIQAIISGRTDDVAVLLRYNVNTKITDDEGSSPLKMALYYKRPEIAELLKKNGAKE